MSRAVLAPFEAYQKSRVTFVQTVAELAQRPQNIEALQSAGKFLTPADSNLLVQFLYFSISSFEHETETVIFTNRRYGSPETSPFG